MPSAAPAPATAPVEHIAVSAVIGGPWSFYEAFRRMHALDQLPQTEIPEIAVAAASTLQVLLILRNDTTEAAGVSVVTTLPEGWAQEDGSQRYLPSPGDVVPIQMELITPSKKSDQVIELAFRVSSAGSPIGLVKMRVRSGIGRLTSMERHAEACR